MKLDLESILEAVEGGKSQADIAAELGMDSGQFSKEYRKLIEAGGEEAVQRSARARELSAEAWLDKGLAVIVQALDKDGRTDSAAARAYAQECARRASIRNPQYRDKVDQTISGPNGGPIKSESTVILSPEEAYKRLLGG